MNNSDWVEEFPAMISVCDTNGIILAMNKREALFFNDQGGKDLIGTSLFDCHKENSVRIIKKLMKTKKTRIYTAEENGKKELIIQGPWYKEDICCGLVEIAIEIEGEIPHLVR